MIALGPCEAHEYPTTQILRASHVGAALTQAHRA